MADIKGGGARIASRHTGRQYGAGYQYRPSREFIYKAGPWSGIDPNAGPDPQMLYGLLGAQLSGGGISALWTRKAIDVSETAYEVVGAFFFTIDNVDTFFELSRVRATGYLQIKKWTASAGPTTVATTLTLTAGKAITAQPWGDFIYIGAQGLATLYRYDVNAGTVAAVAGSPANVQYLLVVDNNMCAIYYDSTSNVWIIAYAVDSDPTDWTSEGSGTQTFASSLGDVQAFVPIENNGMIVGEFGSTLMLPTGTLPPFRFDAATVMQGCAVQYAADSDGRGLLYIGHDRRFHYWVPGQDSIINERYRTFVPRTVDVNRVAFSRHINRFIAHVYSVATEPKLWIIDGTSRAVVAIHDLFTGNIDDDLVVISDSYTSSSGRRRSVNTYSTNVGVETEYEHFAVDPVTTDTTLYADVTLYHKMHFGIPVEVLFIEYDCNTPMSKLDDGAIVIYAYNKTSNGTGLDKTTYLVDPADGSGDPDARLLRIPVHLIGTSFDCIHTTSLDLLIGRLEQIRYVVRIPDEYHVERATV